MIKKLKGGLTISRPRGNLESDYVEISVSDKLSGSQCITIRIGLATFAEALTGLGHADCEFDFWPELVGMRRESKEETIKSEHLPYVKEGPLRENLARPLLAPFEVDGWKGRVDDLFNQHRRTKEGYRVTFVRYVSV